MPDISNTSRTPWRPRCRSRRRGFTLIEIMIVVALLGIIAALVVPSLTKYISGASDAVARTNVQATKRAVVMYYQQNGFYPPAITPDLFMHNKLPVMPTGYAMLYDPITGIVDFTTP